MNEIFCVFLLIESSWKVSCGCSVSGELICRFRPWTTQSINLLLPGFSSKFSEICQIKKMILGLSPHKNTQQSKEAKVHVWPDGGQKTADGAKVRRAQVCPVTEPEPAFSTVTVHRCSFIESQTCGNAPCSASELMSNNYFQEVLLLLFLTPNISTSSFWTRGDRPGFIFLYLYFAVIVDQQKIYKTL